MSVVTLQLTARDPIVARDGRPFGAGQGNRMRSLAWPLPSVVAGSLRTAIVKASEGLNFCEEMPRDLMKIKVAGVFPTAKAENGVELYLPAPSDAVLEPTDDGKTIKQVHRVEPRSNIGGCDFPDDLPLQPVVLSEEQSRSDFKPKAVPMWWPLGKYAEWLTSGETQHPGDWFNNSDFLNAAIQETRDHVAIDEHTGASKESQLFSTAGLNLMHLPRFGVNKDDKKLPFNKRFAKIELSARVEWNDSRFAHLNDLGTLHPLGGERRLVHWQTATANLWACPPSVKDALKNAKRVRMVLTTPAIFRQGWMPALESGPLKDFKLKLVGVSNGRWKAVSGWSLARINDKGQLDPNGKPGPKSIRRMVPVGSVYFFEVEKPGGSAALADLWLNSVSDDEQEQRDGFGLAVWGTW